MSARRPVIEGLTGMLFVLVFLRVGHVSPALALYFSYVAAMVVVFFVDLDHAIIPNAVIVPGLIVALAAALLRIDPFGPGPWMALVGGLVGAGVFMLLYVATRGCGLGMGDVKMAALMGLALGPFRLLIAVLIASVTALAMAALVMVVFRKRLGAIGSVTISMDQVEEPDISERVLGMMVINGKLAVPYGTYLAVGWAAMLLSDFGATFFRLG